MQTFALQRYVVLRSSRLRMPVNRVRLVTVAEGLSWAEAKRQRTADRGPVADDCGGARGPRGLKEARWSARSWGQRRF